MVSKELVILAMYAKVVPIVLCLISMLTLFLQRMTYSGHITDLLKEATFLQMAKLKLDVLQQPSSQVDGEQIAQNAMRVHIVINLE